LNKEDVETIRERISELTRKYEDNRAKMVQLQQQITRLQQEAQRLLEVDQSLRGGISELKRLLGSQASKEEEETEEPRREETNG